MSGFRSLTRDEVQSLVQQGCSAENWTHITVKDPFSLNRVRNAAFHGHVSLGVFDNHVHTLAGSTRYTGIYNSTLYDCAVGDNVYISQVHTLAHYDIDQYAYIENVDSLIVEGESTFGNGIQIDVLNEAGGRALTLYDRLTVQIAYLMTFYRHDVRFLEKLQMLIKRYVSGKRSTRGILAYRCRIQNSGTLRNVHIGPCAKISGVIHVEDSTIESCEEDPTCLGEGVIAHHCIVLSGSKIDGSAMLDKCFIGQNVTIGKQFSAENSVFFANCEGFHGETVSIFAGPYTVTHHKSTLLIAGLFSFFNAGSGTNQSNHMYKLGPVHQGIVERGAKTSSSSYLLWPSRIGAFTAIVGKHFSNLNTTDLPFSYITEEESRSIITPAMNLLTVGTRRDSEKWPLRDGRRSSVKLDLIHFQLFNPYTVGRMLRGHAVLGELQSKASKKQEFVAFGGAYIRRLMLKTCARYYDMGINIYLGSCLSARFQDLTAGASWDHIHSLMEPASDVGTADWVDLCGCFAPYDAIEELIRRTGAGDYDNLEDFSHQLRLLYERYGEFEWNWCYHRMLNRLNVTHEEIGPIHLLQIISNWEKNAVRLNNMIAGDAQKEFNQTAKIGYGIDGGFREQEGDFVEVRGTYEDNSFVIHLSQESGTVRQRAGELISIIEKCV